MKAENRIYKVTYRDGTKERIVGAHNLPPQNQVRSIRLIKEKQPLQHAKNASTKLSERDYIVKHHDGTETLIKGFHNLPEPKSVASIHRVSHEASDKTALASNYLCFADFEYTCGGMANDHSFDVAYGQEILSVGLVVALRTSGEVVDTFYQTIRPLHNQTLTMFCKNLTGLTQAEIDASASFETVLKQATVFCKQYDFSHIYVFGDTDRQILLKDQKRHQAVPGLTAFIAQLQSVDSYLSQLLFQSHLPISLENLKQICNLTTPVSHHALKDAQDLCNVWFLISNGNYNQTVAQRYQTERITKAEYYRNRQFLSLQTPTQQKQEESMQERANPTTSTAANAKESAITSALEVIAYLKKSNTTHPFVSDIKLSAFCDDLLALLGAPEEYFAIKKSRKERQ